jgi:threonine dehydratase
MDPTPARTWPLLSERVGCEIWVKHENDAPTGAFKVRGGIVYMQRLVERIRPAGVVAATRGNHGQSIAFAARRAGLSCTIVVPEGNGAAKNRAMRALGATLVIEGHDFQAALEHATALARDRGLHLVPSFHPDLVEGVASYALELFDSVPDLDEVYVPIGLGSGACGVIAARDALGLSTRVVGVVAEEAPCYALSFAAGRPIATETAETFADGLAVRVPNPDAVSTLLDGAARIVTVGEDEIRSAMRILSTDAHTIAEGAGAAALAAALGQPPAATRTAVILSGGNIDPALYRSALKCAA